MESRWLVIVDADRIHEYVFSPHRLKLIRGASAVQAQLNEKTLVRELRRFGVGNCGPPDWRAEDHPTLGDGADWELIYAGGGTAMVLFREEVAAKDYARWAEQIYFETTWAATATAVAEGWDTDFHRTLEKAHLC